MADMENSGQAIIEDGSIVIRVPLDALPQALEGAWAMHALEARYKITNIQEFSAELVCELNREAEDGTTPIHTMFDKAINEAIGQGAFGVEEHEDQKL